jgi:hypothetical protein
MPCAITSGFTIDCKDAVGGLKNIYFASGVSGTTITSSVSGGVSLVSGVTFYKYELMPQGADSFDEAIQSNPANGTIFYQQTVVGNFPKMSQVNRNKFLAIAQAKPLVVIQKKDGTLWLLGEVYGCEVTAGSHLSGSAMGDFNGQTLTVVGNEPNPCQQLTSISAITIGS